MKQIQSRLREIAKTGAFGQGELIGVDDASSGEIGAQFMSCVSFQTVRIKTDDGVETKLPIFVKIQAEPTEEFSRDSDGQFLTEVTMYRSVLPDLGALELRLCPKMYYGVATAGANVKEDIVVLEDLLQLGYSVAKSLFLDVEHVVYAMKCLGKFHGLSYEMKNKFPEKILTYKLLCKRQGDFNEGCGMSRHLRRGFKYFLDNHPDNEIAKKAFDKISQNDMNATWEKMRTPEEPFAVIIHGDYTKSNVMYKYDGGMIADMKIFDFGTSIYSDPAIDIAIFLYLNTSKYFWEDHWDDALLAYWDGVTSVATPAFSFEDFLKNFAKRAVWGYVPCCFYKPFLMFPDLVAEGPAKGATEEDKADWFLNLGGDEGTEAVTDIVRHLLKRGYLEEFVNNFEL